LISPWWRPCRGWRCDEAGLAKRQPKPTAQQHQKTNLDPKYYLAGHVANYKREPCFMPTCGAKKKTPPAKMAGGVGNFRLSDSLFFFARLLVGLGC
jgi:hypothetical protein